MRRGLIFHGAIPSQPYTCDDPSKVTEAHGEEAQVVDLKDTLVAKRSSPFDGASAKIEVNAARVKIRGEWRM
jgi:hypothetical protein